MHCIQPKKRGQCSCCVSRNRDGHPNAVNGPPSSCRLRQVGKARKVPHPGGLPATLRPNKTAQPQSAHPGFNGSTPPATPSNANTRRLPDFSRWPMPPTYLVTSLDDSSNLVLGVVRVHWRGNGCINGCIERLRVHAKRWHRRQGAGPCGPAAPGSGGADWSVRRGVKARRHD